MTMVGMYHEAGYDNLACPGRNARRIVTIESEPGSRGAKRSPRQRCCRTRRSAAGRIAALRLQA
jgi:hypothetical protein